MTKLKAKVELLNRITALGFTFDEAQQLRRISMTLSKWAEGECNGEIERNEATGKPERNSRAWVDGYAAKRIYWPVADREAGALKRLKTIVDARNTRETTLEKLVASNSGTSTTFQQDRANALIHAYHQSDPRGCALYLVKASDLPEATDEAMRKHSGEWPLKSEETRLQWKLSCYYTRGLAVCA